MLRAAEHCPAIGQAGIRVACDVTQRIDDRRQSVAVGGVVVDVVCGLPVGRGDIAGLAHHALRGRNVNRLAHDPAQTVVRVADRMARGVFHAQQVSVAVVLVAGDATVGIGQAQQVTVGVVLVTRGGRLTVDGWRHHLDQVAGIVILVSGRLTQRIGHRRGATVQVVAEGDRLRRRATSSRDRRQTPAAVSLGGVGVAHHRAVALADRGYPVAGAVIRISGGVARRSGVSVRTQGGGHDVQPALAVVVIAHLLTGDRRAAAGRHFLDRQTRQLAAGVAEDQAVAIGRRDRGELTVAVIEAVAGTGLQIAQRGQSAAGVIGLLPLVG